MDSSVQYLRHCRLIVSGSDLGGLDLSQFRIKFVVKTTDAMTPNTADIRVYNLSQETANEVQNLFNQVVLEGGYENNYGVIFQGNIKQIIQGRESATDTFIDIVAGDGDRAYNFSIVNATLAKGSFPLNQAALALKQMSKKGVTPGNLGDLGVQQLPRGKVMYGMARTYLRNIAITNQSYWSIQKQKVNFVKKSSYLPGTAFSITSKTGMIGTPQQTDYGVNVKCLLNPNIQISQRIKIDNSSVQRLKLPLEQIASAKGDVKQIIALTPRSLQADGFYYVQVLQHSGDTRGLDWYTSITGINLDATTNPRNSVGSIL